MSKPEKNNSAIAIEKLTPETAAKVKMYLAHETAAKMASEMNAKKVDPAMQEAFKFWEKGLKAEALEKAGIASTAFKKSVNSLATAADWRKMAEMTAQG